ncbi:MAG TPA: hypothetical protein VK451_11530 [Methyloceanibacter sp.]|nr:hypothetical protein [Methyloceanibacter sp.]
MTENALPRDIAAAAADLLDQGAIINRLSRPLTVAALIGLIVGLGVELGALLVAGLLLVTLAGLAETYLAIRIGFDAKLFRRLAEGNDPVATLGRLDTALIKLGVLTESHPERAIEQRASSARRLFILQGSALVLQVAVVLLATAFAQAHVT